MHWEYKTIRRTWVVGGRPDAAGEQTDDVWAAQAYANQLGDVGWELVSVVGELTDGNTVGFVYFFKRPLPKG